MMKKLNFTAYLFIGLIIFLNGCKKEDNPLDHEQYLKQVYLVGANVSNNEGRSVIKLSYLKSTDLEQVAYLSVASGGSRNVDQDISAVVADAGNAAINRYNFLYLYKDGQVKYQRLRDDYFRVPDPIVQIKKNEVYGTTPVYIKTGSLHCDSLYALTFKIASVSQPDYISIRKTDTVLMMSINMINNYSDSYQVNGKTFIPGSTVVTDTVSIGATRVLKAVDYRTVRFFHLTTEETLANAPAYGVKVQVNDDNTLTIVPWGTLAITSGGGTYNPNTRKFDLWYNYKEGTVNRQFKGTFIRPAAVSL